MCTLIHFELPCVAGTMLFTEPLNLFALCAGQACHTNCAATQHGAQIILNRQICIPEKAEGGRKRGETIFYLTLKIYNKLLLLL